MRFFNTLVGNRQPLPNGIKDGVKIYCWGPTRCITALHIGIEVNRGSERHYLSFYPYSVDADRSLSQIRTGTAAYFEENFDMECSYQGYRKANDHDPEIINLNAEVIFDRISKLPREEQAELRRLGSPNDTIELHSLDLEKMIQKIAYFKRVAPLQAESKQLDKAEPLLSSEEHKDSPAYEAKWGAWASVKLHQKDTYNCSSMALEVLYAGGLQNLTSTLHDAMGVAGGLLGTGLGVASYLNNRVLQEAFIKLAIGFFGSRGAGGFVEGWVDMQSVLNLAVRSEKPDATPQTVPTRCKKALKTGAQHIGLRLMGATLSTFVSLVKSDRFIPDWFATTPELVMSIARQAKDNENALYLPIMRPVFA